jgi:predicted transport protein
MYSLRISKYVFVKLENEGNKEPISYNGYTIEHILPQNKDMRFEWKQALGENYAEIQAKYIHSLGNLTLTRYNSEMGDKPFEDKLEVYKESAMHTLNKYVVQQSTWNEQKILTRTEILANCACAAWKAPVLDAETLEKYAPKEEKVNQSYDIGHYNMDMFTKMLYLNLHNAILEIEPKAKEEFKKLYIAHKLKTNFVDVVPQRAGLRISVNLDFDEVYDPEGICKDVTDLGRWGNGDVEIRFDSLEKLDAVMEIIKQAIDKQK